jgi:hypothetical protein
MGGKRLSGGVRAASAAFVWLAALLLMSAPRASQQPSGAAEAHANLPRFQSSHECLACHNGLSTPTGEDISIGSSWRGSMMANSARDPYWHAAVRREIIDHPSAQQEIEDECSVCHMPMARTLARASGGHGEIFAHLPIGRNETPLDPLAADGVSCTLCHQIGEDRFGSRESFTGGFVVTVPAPAAPPSMFGPFNVDAGRAALMHSATGVRPTESLHVQQSELCATCHSLFTQALDSRGQAVGSLAEQVPFLEWRHSAFRTERSCQSCHMPIVAEPTAVSSVLGEPRPDVSRHTFVGGNFFMLRMLNRYRLELGVEATSAELDAAVRATLLQLQQDTARLAVERAGIVNGELSLDVDVRNLTGHKLPTGYPSRRAWLHVTVRDAGGRAIFESGAVTASGAIQGNDNDADAARFEAHHDEIRSPQDVQIYESIMTDAAGVPTTGLLSGARYVKDNRLLPRGFDKGSAEADIAVSGDARQDDDFGAEGDRVRYVVNVAQAMRPLQIEVELRFQTISYRWADNLKRYDAPEPRRFTAYYDSMSSQSSTVLARASARVD